jgi:hypothetical protein
MTTSELVLDELGNHVDGYTGSTHLSSTRHGDPLPPDAGRMHVSSQAVRPAGLAPLRVHDVNHPGAALLAAAGVDPKEVSRRDGDATVIFTNGRYGQPLPEADRGPQPSSTCSGPRAQQRIGHRAGTLSRLPRRLASVVHRSPR